MTALQRSALALAPALLAGRMAAAPVPVRHPEGVVHGFLVLKDAGGNTIAEGDLDQTSRGDKVTSRLRFRFRDGSFQEETTVFTQRHVFRLVSDRLVQRGPAFPRDSDFTLNAASGRAVVKIRERDGKEQVFDEKLELPDDVANGLVATCLKNVAADTLQVSLGMVVAAPKPTVVRLRIVAAGEEAFTVAGVRRAARRWDVKLELAGIKGFLAKVLKKLPPDTRVLISPGEAPAFVRSVGPVFVGGAPWRIELTAPSFADERQR